MAKSHTGHVSFQFKTGRLSGPTIAGVLILMLLASLIPGALLLMKNEQSRQVPYLEIDVSGSPEHIAASPSLEILNPAD